jgi:GNAT superfamily N-acetyltransferase
VTGAELEARRLETQLAAWRIMPGHETPGDGWATVVPALPDRPIMNSVVWRDPDGFTAGLGEVEEIYRGAGVRAWCVWVPERERGIAAALAAAGYTLDGLPTAMACELDGLELGSHEAGPQPDPSAGWPELAVINDRAYPFPDGTFCAAFDGLDPAGMRFWVVPGRAGLATHHHAGDCGVCWVGTDPDHGRRGLATGLLRRALLDAREAGCATASLESSGAGRPVYQRLGFRALGSLELWERRV